MKKHETHRRVIRPIATIGFSYMLTLAIACYLTPSLSAFIFLVAMVAVLLIAVIRSLRNQRVLLILLSIGVACGVYSIYTYCNYNPVLALNGKTAPISAVVTDLSTTGSGKSVLTVQLDRKVVDAPIPTKVNLYLDEPGDFLPGDKVSGTARFYLPSEAYGTSAPLQSAKADGIYLYGSAKTTELSITRSTSFSLSAWLYNLRLLLEEKANDLFSGETAAVFQGMLLGNNSAVSDKTYRDFIHTGILHVMVVSGLHLVVVSQFVIRTLKALHVRRKTRYVIGMAVVPFFMAVAGFTPSVNRAGIMLLLLYASKLLDRDADSLTSIGFIGLSFTLFSPYLVTDLGFQLTYLSTIGIILFSRTMAGFIKNKLKLKNGLLLWINDTFCVTPAAMLLTLPVVALRFQAFPTLSPLFNLMLSPLFTVVLILGVPMLLFSFIPILSIVAEGISMVITLLITAIRWFAAICTTIPFSYIPLGYQFICIQILLFIPLILLIGFRSKARFRYLITIFICIASLTVSTIGNAVIGRDSLTVATCTQGKEKAVVLTYQDQMIILDCNEMALRLSETTHLQKIPFVYTQENLPLIAEYAEYCQIDTVCTHSVIPEGTIACRELFTPTNAEIRFTIPIQLTTLVEGE